MSTKLSTDMKFADVHCLHCDAALGEHRYSAYIDRGTNGKHVDVVSLLTCPNGAGITRRMHWAFEPARAADRDALSTNESPTTAAPGPG